MKKNLVISTVAAIAAMNPEGFIPFTLPTCSQFLQVLRLL